MDIVKVKLTIATKCVCSVIRLAFLYFAAVFASGMVLGTLRVILLVPKLGAQAAELLEIPFMLAVVYVAGSWIARRAESSQQAYAVGVLALLLLLAAEMSLAIVLLRKSPVEALLNKDPVSGTAYYLALLVYAFLPGIRYRQRNQ